MGVKKERDKSINNFWIKLHHSWTAQLRLLSFSNTAIVTNLDTNCPPTRLYNKRKEMKLNRQLRRQNLILFRYIRQDRKLLCDEGFCKPQCWSWIALNPVSYLPITEASLRLSSFKILYSFLPCNRIWIFHTSRCEIKGGPKEIAPWPLKTADTIIWQERVIRWWSLCYEFGVQTSNH